jgi:hypothetical protein
LKWFGWGVALNRGLLSRAQLVSNRCVNRFLIYSPLDLSSSPVYLADAISAVERQQSGSVRQEKVVALNSRVTLLDRTTDETASFTLVSATGDVAKEGELSCLSPLGIRLLGRGVGDRVKFRFLGCRVDLQVVDIAHA